MEVKRTWYSNSEIKSEHSNLPIRQIYVWFITSDNQIVIVGRGEKWQFPGGKPEEGESEMDTIKRELFEEAGLNVDVYSEKPEFFGYYLIENDINPKWESGAPYLQIRYTMQVNKNSSEIELSVNEREGDLDTLEEAKFVPLNELSQHISWMNDDNEEYMRVMEIKF